MKYDFRINSVLDLLKVQKESLIQYFTNKEFDLTSFSAHTNKEILFYDFMIPGLEIDNETIKQILSYDYVTSINYTVFVPGVHLYKHIDPCPADENYQMMYLHKKFIGDPDYRRIHFPINDSTENCFMIFDNQKYSWKRGETQIFHVNKHAHEVFNQTEHRFHLLMVDVLVGKRASI